MFDSNGNQRIIIRCSNPAYDHVSTYSSYFLAHDGMESKKWTVTLDWVAFSTVVVLKMPDYQNCQFYTSVIKSGSCYILKKWDSSYLAVFDVENGILSKWQNLCNINISYDITQAHKQTKVKCGFVYEPFGSPYYYAQKLMTPVVGFPFEGLGKELSFCLLPTDTEKMYHYKKMDKGLFFSSGWRSTVYS